MPYFVKEVRNGFKVCKKTDPGRCFSNAPLTEDMAKKQMTAINISEHSDTGGGYAGGMIDKFLATAKEFAKKAGYKDWADLKRAPAPHKLELRGVAFGRRGYKDFIQYAMQDGEEEAQKKRAAYLARATKIKGDWRDDKYSPNSLAINILWGGEDELAGSGIILNAGLYTLGLIPFFRWSSPVFNFVPNPRLPSLKDMFEMTEESYITDLDDLDEDVNGFMLQERAETYKIYRKADVVVVAVRGTAEFKDVKAWTPVALGNVRSTERVDPDLHDIPLDLQEYKDDGCIIFGTGHSLAGVILDDLLKNGHLTQVVSFNPAVERQMLGNSNNIRFYMDGDPLLNIMGCRANNAIILAYQGTFDVLAGLFKPKVLDVDKHFITSFEGHLPSKYPTKIGIYTASDEAAALQKEGDDWEMVGGITPETPEQRRAREDAIEAQRAQEQLERVQREFQARRARMTPAERAAEDAQWDAESDEDDVSGGKVGGAIPMDKALYEKAKEIVYKQYDKPSAYRSGALVKKYKELGGTYDDDGERSLARWFKEKWSDIGNKSYPVYRPTERITKDTPLTPDEIEPKNLKQQIDLKQKIKGDKNLPPFIMKGDLVGGVINPALAQQSQSALDSITQSSILARYRPYWNVLLDIADRITQLVKWADISKSKIARNKYERKLKTVLDLFQGNAFRGTANWNQHSPSELREIAFANVAADDGLDVNNESEMVGGAASLGASLGGIKENVVTPLDDGDIRHNLGAGAKILKYNELAGINSLDELLPNNRSFCVILYLDSSHSGHWCAVTRNASGVYFFDSYGGAPDSQLRWVPEATRDSLGVDGTYLTTILRTATQPVYYNKHDYQSEKDGVATCGRWCCLFIKKGMNCEDFYYFIKQQERKYKLNGDMLVSKLMPYD